MRNLKHKRRAGGTHNAPTQGQSARKKIERMESELIITAID